MMFNNQVKNDISKITKNEFDQAQIILVYAGARQAATFSIPKSTMTETRMLLDKIGIHNGLGRIREDAEIIIGDERRVNRIVELVLEMSSNASVTQKRKPYLEFLKMVANDDEIVDNLKLLSQGVKLDYNDNHAIAMCIVPHVPHDPRCMPTLLQGMEFSRVLLDLHPELYWNVISSKASQTLRILEAM